MQQVKVCTYLYWSEWRKNLSIADRWLTGSSLTEACLQHAEPCSKSIRKKEKLDSLELLPGLPFLRVKKDTKQKRQTVSSAK